VIDAGAGCGAMSLGLVAAPGAAHRSFDIIAIDRDAAALRIAAAAVRAYGAGRAAIATRTDDVASCALPAADLVVLGTVLNELSAAARLAVVERALAAIGDDGAVIILEPALRETSRALHELRDAVLARKLATVFAPCTRTCAPCPALADPNDWCHEARHVALPPHTAELARVTRLRDSGLKFSYLVLRRATTPLVEAPADAIAWRVVSEPISPKGKIELYGCADSGRIALRLLRRHRGSANRGFERAHRGDVLVIAGAVADADLIDVTGAATVDRIEPAGGAGP
jgi:ribosomal protein RSM22 (predicted rRNA methylase)